MSDPSNNVNGRAAALVGLLEGLGVAIQTRPDGDIEVSVGIGVPALAVDPEQILGVEKITTPWDAPAVMLGHRPRDLPPVKVMILAGDVAFKPVADGSNERVLGDGRMPHVVTDLPPVLGFSELRRLLAAGLTVGSLDRIMGIALAAAAGIEGARRAGLDAEGIDALDAELDQIIDRMNTY